METLEKSLKATFVPANQNPNSNEEHQVDFCCRSLYKCDAHKRNELNQTTESHMKHCGCIHLFQICLKNLNTSLSNEVVFIHAINASKCYSKDHPINKCIQFETYADSNVEWLRLIDSDERQKYFSRCVKYDLNTSLPQQLQTFDVPFNVYALSTSNGKLLTKTNASQSIDIMIYKNKNDTLNCSHFSL